MTNSDVKKPFDCLEQTVNYLYYDAGMYAGMLLKTSGTNVDPLCALKLTSEKEITFIM